MTLPIAGMNVSLQAGTNKLDISAGTGKDSTDATTITVPSGTTLTIDPATTGFGGLDTGALVAGDRYAVYVIKSATGNVGAIMSVEFDGDDVTWPGGNAPRFRRVGSVIADSNADIQLFVQVGGSNDRTVTWQIDLLEKSVVLNEDEPAWKFKEMEQLVGPEASTAQLLLKPAAGVLLHIREAHSGGGPLISVGSETTYNFMPTSGADRMEFRTSNGTASVYVLGYQETI